MLGTCQDLAARQFYLPTGVSQTQSAEAESVWGGVSGGTVSEQTNCCGVSWSSGAQEWLVSSAVNAALTLDYYLPDAGTYDLDPVGPAAGRVSSGARPAVRSRRQELIASRL